MSTNIVIKLRNKSLNKSKNPQIMNTNIVIKFRNKVHLINKIHR